MARLWAQFLRFGMVGALAFAIDYGLLMLLTQVVGINAVLAAACSFCVSVAFNYVASMRFVFTHRDELSVARERVLFLLLSLVGLGINEVIIWAGTSQFGSSAVALTAIKVVATGVEMVWNFASRKHWLDAGTQEST